LIIRIGHGKHSDTVEELSMVISKRVGAAGFATMMAAAALSMFVGTGVAEARCRGVGGETTSDFWVGGTQRVKEVPDPGTCNDNGAYGFTLHDTSGDDHYAEFQKDGDGNGTYEHVAYAGLEYGNPRGGLSFGDSTHRAYERLCIRHVDTAARRCGFGQDGAPRGLTEGF
jgi:hypothetical protein